MKPAASAPTLAIIGGESLLGRELRDVLADTKLPCRVKLIGAVDDAAGVLTEEDGEALIMAALNQEGLSGARVAMLAGAATANWKAHELAVAQPGGPAEIDLSGALEEHPAARLRAPVVEAEGFTVASDAVHVIAHPAAIAVALFYARLQPRHPVRRALVQIFEPASERGRRGIEELKQQSVGLLSLQRLSQEVFDAQIGFNMLVRYGNDAPESLSEIEARIERHLATLLAPIGAPMPSLRLVQAPVFHGYSFSIWAEFATDVTPLQLAEALASAQVEVRNDDQEVPTNVGVAGQSGVTIGAIEMDRNHPRAAWFWMVADNLRVAAENAVAVARGLFA